MDNMNELNLDEMNNIVGGAGGSPHPLPDKSGCIVYRIARRKDRPEIRHNRRADQGGQYNRPQRERHHGRVLHLYPRMIFPGILL